MTPHDDFATLRPYDHDDLCASRFDANRHNPEAACNCSKAAWSRLETELARLERYRGARDA